MNNAQQLYDQPFRPVASVTPVAFDSYICSRIFGGLGNQMFQYAAGFTQARRLGVQLLLHVETNRKLKHAVFGLDAFPITGRVWSLPEFKEPMLQKAWRKLSGGKKKRASFWTGARLDYQRLDFDEQIYGVKQGTYLNGYFQSEYFFQPFAEEIRAEFDLAHFRSNIAPNFLAALDVPNTVSVHIRRGDYALRPETLAIHGLLEKPYYEQARADIEARLGACHFLVFSDDPEAAASITADWPNRMLCNTGHRLHDLYMMAHCQHHIVANSSFSWWGAWLNPSNQKLVYAPKQWFAAGSAESKQMDDICPPQWLRL
ncbi:alpha-1,2-fucosyltransferase [Rhodobacteraceae bacterium RKSG542]|uniref:alpha-1,2-fucosyltransferase n=1 Tax=Pseudovibrio flavus TaxID=2529854 RepID=UPI0012BB4FE3|nr:alpha-1,2-fucosyltransferase [Pseudovibrio flavus]MTI16489.1 alpha-1,2-fucosyltransferase [Pseudovibrio flavus]